MSSSYLTKGRRKGPEEPGGEDVIKIRGQLTRTLFRSEKNDWTIGLFLVDAPENKEIHRKQIKAVGQLSPLSIGAMYELEGRFEEVERYGEQFTLSSSTMTISESSTKDVEAFLKQHLGAFKAKR